MGKESLARFLSIVLGPQVWLPLLITVTLLKTNLSSQQLLILFPSILFLQFIGPLGYIYIAEKKGMITAWDLPTKKERYKVLLIACISYFISTVLIYFIGNRLLFNLNLIILSLSIILSLITIFWKISIHTSLNTVGSIIINFLFNWQLPILYLTIPIIFWARLYLKRHNIPQLIGGILVSSIFVYGGLNFLGYLK